MKTLATLLVLVLCAPLVMAQQGISGANFAGVHEQCSKANASQGAAEGGAPARACVFYLMAVIDGNRFFRKPSYCIPDSASLGDAIDAVIKFGNEVMRDPEGSERKLFASVNGMASLMVESALMARFPCEKNSPQK